MTRLWFNFIFTIGGIVLMVYFLRETGWDGKCLAAMGMGVCCTSCFRDFLDAAIKQMSKQRQEPRP